MQRNAAEVTSLDVGSWFAPQYSAARIPRLSEVLQRYKGRIHLHLELKNEQPELPSVVAAELLAAGWVVGAEAAKGGSFCAPGLTITSFHLEQLERARTVRGCSLTRTHCGGCLLLQSLDPVLGPVICTGEDSWNLITAAVLPTAAAPCEAGMVAARDFAQMYC